MTRGPLPVRSRRDSSQTIFGAAGFTGADTRYPALRSAASTQHWDQNEVFSRRQQTIAQPRVTNT
jgi:hypothetical protein